MVFSTYSLALRWPCYAVAALLTVAALGALAAARRSRGGAHGVPDDPP
ncbi:hypothetical protein [Streptomyces sp. NBC_01233]|nr:hypothetical protein OG332_01385 [Streptomyces sp. NBC_01233]